MLRTSAQRRLVRCIASNGDSAVKFSRCPYEVARRIRAVILSSWSLTAASGVLTIFLRFVCCSTAITHCLRAVFEDPL